MQKYLKEIRVRQVKGVSMVLFSAWRCSFACSTPCFFLASSTSSFPHPLHHNHIKPHRFAHLTRTALLLICTADSFSSVEAEYRLSRHLTHLNSITPCPPHAYPSHRTLRQHALAPPLSTTSTMEGSSSTARHHQGEHVPVSHVISTCPFRPFTHLIPSLFHLHLTEPSDILSSHGVIVGGQPPSTGTGHSATIRDWIARPGRSYPSGCSTRAHGSRRGPKST